MSSEREQQAQREAKLEELVRLGVAPYPNRFDRSATISAIVAEHAGAAGEALEAAKPVVRAAGRILSLRGFGKANFAVLSDGIQRIQVYVREDALGAQDFRIYKLLDLGDHIGVEGRVFRTKTNELTIWASSMTTGAGVSCSWRSSQTAIRRIIRSMTASRSSRQCSERAEIIASISPISAIVPRTSSPANACCTSDASGS